MPHPGRLPASPGRDRRQTGGAASDTGRRQAPRIAAPAQLARAARTGSTSSAAATTRDSEEEHDETSHRHVGHGPAVVLAILGR